MPTATRAILAQIFELVTRPVAETMAMFNAIHDAGLFFLGGTKAHGYDIGPATVPARAAAALASSTARLAAAKVSAYLRQVVTPTALAVQSLLDALFARVTIAETLKVDRITIRRWLGSRDSWGHRTPAISGAKPE